MKKRTAKLTALALAAMMALAGCGRRRKHLRKR